MSFDAGSIISTIDVDRNPFNIGLDQAKVDAQRFEDRTYRTRLAVDDAAANANLDEENAKLDSFATKVATARLGIDTGDSAEKVAAEDAAVDAFGNKRVSAKVDVDTSGADRGLADIKNKAADAAGPGGMGLLLTTALSLGPSLVPIGAELLAGLAAIAPMALAAGAGIGAFALAAAPDLSKVEKAVSGTLKGFQALTAPTVMPVITGALGLVIPLFSTLVPLVDSTATELTHLETAASSALQAPFWRGFISFLGGEAGPAINSFTSLVGGIVKGFAGVSVAMAPIIADVEGGLAGFGARIASWGQNLGTSSGFATFLRYVETEGPVVGTLLQTLAGTIGHLVVALAPIGAVVLGSLGALTSFTDFLTGLNGTATTVAVTIGLLALAYAKLSGPISAASSALGLFKTAVDRAAVGEATAGVTGLEGAFAGLVAAMGGLSVAAPVFAVTAAAVVGGLWLMHDAARANADAVTSFGGGVIGLSASTLPALHAAMDRTLGQMVQMRGDLGLTAEQVGVLVQNNQHLDESTGFWNNLPGLLKGSLSPTNDLNVAFNKLNDQFHAMQAESATINNNLGFLQDRFDISRQSAEALAQSLNINLTKALSPQQILQFNAGLQQQAAQAGLTEGALRDLASGAGVSLSQMASSLSKAAQATAQGWAGLGNSVTAFASSTLPPTSAAIAQFYATSELQGAQFSQNIQKAIQQGYNPTLISSILQAGPTQAGALLQGLVSTNGTALVTLVNSASSAIYKEGQQAIITAQLVNDAVQTKSVEMGKQLPVAQALYLASTAQSAAQAAQSVAAQYNLTLPQVAHISKEYGDILPQSIFAQIAEAQAAAKAQAGAATSGMGGAMPGLTAITSGLAGALPTALNAQAANAGGGGAAQITGMIGGYNSMTGSVNSTIANIVQIAEAVARDPGGWAGVGASTMQGWADGIVANMGAPIGAVGNAAGQILTAAHHAIANPPYPSQRYREEIGASTMAGWALGVTENTGLVTGAVAGVANASVAAARGGAVPYGASTSFSEGLANLPNTVGRAGPVLNSSRVWHVVVQGSADSHTVAALGAVIDQKLDEHDNEMLAELGAL